jgi:hypothetical protein
VGANSPYKKRKSLEKSFYICSCCESLEKSSLTILKQTLTADEESTVFEKADNTVHEEVPICFILQIL